MDKILNFNGFEDYGLCLLKTSKRHKFYYLIFSIFLFSPSLSNKP